MHKIKEIADHFTVIMISTRIRRGVLSVSEIKS